MPGRGRRGRLRSVAYDGRSKPWKQGRADPRTSLSARRSQHSAHYPKPDAGLRGWVTRQVGRLGWPRGSHRGPRGARSPGLPRHRLRRGPAPGRPRDAFAAALDAAYADPRRLHHAGRDGTAGARQRPGRDAEALGLRPDEVTFTASGTERCTAGCWACTAAPSAGATRSCTRAVEHSAVLQAGAWTRSSDARRSRSTPRPGRPRRASTSRRHGRGLPVRQPRGRHAAARRRGRRPPGRRTPLRRRLRLGRAAPAARRLVGARGVGAQVGRPGGRRHPRSYAAARGGASPFPEDDRAAERESGFENVPAILAAAAALQAVVAERDAERRRQHALVDRIRAVVAGICPTSRWWAHPRTGSPTW